MFHFIARVIIKYVIKIPRTGCVFLERALEIVN